MTRSSWVSFCLLIFSASTAPRAQEGETTIAGWWEGHAIIEGKRLDFALDISAAGSVLQIGAYIPRDGRFNRPLTGTQFNPPKISFQFLQRHQTSFNGEWRGDTIAGTATSHGRPGTFELQRKPRPAVPYTEEEITWKSGDVTIAASLLLPKGQGPFPLIVTAHGSGDHTRDRFHGDFFARNGVAMLINDKRGSGGSGGRWQDVGFKELAEDIVGGVNAVKDRPEIDKNRIGLFGISQAGWIEPLTASMSPEIDFLIIVSGPTIPVEQEGFYDYKYSLRQKGHGDDVIAKAVNYLTMNNRVTRSGEGYPELMAEWRKLREEPWWEDFGMGAIPPMPPKNKSRDWYRRVIDFTNVPYLEKLDIPILWIYGEDDESVPTAECVEIAKSIQSRLGKDYTINIYPEADHGIRIYPKPGEPFRWFGYQDGYPEDAVAWMRNKNLLN